MKSWPFRGALIGYFLISLNGAGATSIDLTGLYEAQKNNESQLAVLYLQGCMNSNEPENDSLKGCQTEVEAILALYHESVPHRFFQPALILDTIQLLKMIDESDDLTRDHFNPLDILDLRKIYLDQKVTREEVSWRQIYTDILEFDE